MKKVITKYICDLCKKEAETDENMYEINNSNGSYTYFSDHPQNDISVQFKVKRINGNTLEEIHVCLECSTVINKAVREVVNSRMEVKNETKF